MLIELHQSLKRNTSLKSLEVPFMLLRSDRDVAPVAALQSRPRERQVYVTVLVPCPPAILSHVILLGLSKYVRDRARYFLA